MDTLRLLLWFSMTAAVLQVYCAADPLEGRAGGGKQGCVVGPPRPCGKNNQFICRRILKQPENGGTPCPPEVERNDPNRPAANHHLCTVGAWSACFPLPGYPHIMVKRREPVDMTADISTCPDLVAPCSAITPVNCVMTEWSEWYQFDLEEIEVRVRFVLVEPHHGGTACPHDMEIREIDGNCHYGSFGSWTPLTNTNQCYRYRTSNNGCNTDVQYKDAPCGGPTWCNTWSAWGNWAPVGGACTPGGEEERFRHSSNCNPQRQTRPCPSCNTWSAWGNWAPVGGACTPGGEEERFRHSSNCNPQRQTRACQCTVTWTNWAIISFYPCRQSRYTLNPCYGQPSQSENRDCIDVCIVPNVFNPLSAAGGMILEARAGSIARKKRNDPWCPEEPWIIYGRSDGCTALKNITYFRCTQKNCQNHASSPAGVICVPDKFTDLTVYLENCPYISGGQDTMIVKRPMECVCHQVAGDTCTKFLGP